MVNVRNTEFGELFQVKSLMSLGLSFISCEMRILDYEGIPFLFNSDLWIIHPLFVNMYKWTIYVNISWVMPWASSLFRVRSIPSLPQPGLLSPRGTMCSGLLGCWDRGSCSHFGIGEQGRRCQSCAIETRTEVLSPIIIILLFHWPSWDIFNQLVFKMLM